MVKVVIILKKRVTKRERESGEVPKNKYRVEKRNLIEKKRSKSRNVARVDKDWWRDMDFAV